eukprot:SAG11_NODE_145_length_14811_cov_24.558931_10_plen_301_part_00
MVYTFVRHTVPVAKVSGAPAVGTLIHVLSLSFISYNITWSTQQADPWSPKNNTKTNSQFPLTGPGSLIPISGIKPVWTTVGGKTWAPRYIGVTRKPYLNRAARLVGSWQGSPIDLSRASDPGMPEIEEIPQGTNVPGMATAPAASPKKKSQNGSVPTEGLPGRVSFSPVVKLRAAKPAVPTGTTGTTDTTRTADPNLKSPQGSSKEPVEDEDGHGAKQPAQAGYQDPIGARLRASPTPDDSVVDVGRNSGAARLYHTRSYLRDPIYGDLRTLPLDTSRILEIGNLAHHDLRASTAHWVRT